MSSAKDDNTLSRREFIRNTGAVGVGSFLTAAGILGCQDTPETKEQPKMPTVPKVPEKPKEPQLSTRTFGRTGVKVSVLGLGGMPDTINNQLMLKQARRWGLRYWDTANSYGGGNSELGYGKFFASNPEVRKEIFLVTKGVAHEGAADLTRMLDLSLERMQTDYIDLYFVHALRNGGALVQHADEYKAWAEKAKAAKKIRFFGFSTHSNMPECLQAAAKLGWIDGIMLTYNYRLMFSDQMKSAINACTKAGIGLTAMKVQAKGFSESAEQEQELLGRFLAKGFNDAQARIKAVWTNPRIASACVQMPNMNILMSNIAAAMDKTTLSDTELKLMEQNAKETSASYCACCSDICEQAVAGDAPICDVLRYMMYHNSYGDCDRAKKLFADLPGHIHARLEGLDYSLAEKNCPQGIAIGTLMRQAVRTLA